MLSLYPERSEAVGSTDHSAAIAGSDIPISKVSVRLGKQRRNMAGWVQGWVNLLIIQASKLGMSVKGNLPGFQWKEFMNNRAFPYHRDGSLFNDLLPELLKRHFEEIPVFPFPSVAIYRGWIFNQVSFISLTSFSSSAWACAPYRC